MAGLNETPSGERVQIAILGRTNAGKSALINAMTGQNLAIVSPVSGTTTDPVAKSMELLPLGPVTLIDTPGLDDESELGALRIEKTRQVLTKCDIAIVVADAAAGLTELEKSLIDEMKSREIRHIVVLSKCDLTKPEPVDGAICVSAVTGEGIEELKNRLAAFATKGPEQRLVGDLVSPGDVVILVTPIDASAPKGRLILPQQQTIRDLLESGAMPLVCRETELAAALDKINPRLVITDSQVFGMVSKIVPENIPLTSFSMLMARYKGNFADAVNGAKALDKIKAGDKILISEGCTHHRQCEDIGTVKLPGWIRKHTGVEPEFSFTSGTEFPDNLADFALVVHCGGCTLNPRALRHRYGLAAEAGVPMTNYGVAIAHMHGILARAAKPLLQ
ncbi:MAG: [FeFe] hydrogenase H-cluster maturation GTPase HydF [Ruminococcaceae bacterium]|nr:[FeFe] hydrogenase H-cluster maturation GTPase HydF [Oscillospiraceae bacterium]